jgi:hypothetical protein
MSLFLIAMSEAANITLAIVNKRVLTNKILDLEIFLLLKLFFVEGIISSISGKILEKRTF